MIRPAWKWLPVILWCLDRAKVSGGSMTRIAQHATRRSRKRCFASDLVSWANRRLRFLEGLLRTHRDGKSQARKVLSLLSLYHRDDVLAAIERAVRYHAFSRHSLERILAVQARPRPPLECWNDRYRPSLTDDTPVEPRPTADYQELLGEPR